MNTDTAQQNKSTIGGNKTANDSSNLPGAVKAVSHGVKETEPLKSADSLKVVSTEIEVSPEVQKAGVQVLKDTIELPPDLTKLGVSPSGIAASAAGATVTQVVLPITDDQVLAGMHMKVSSALKWLATWCTKKLKKAHIVLKSIHGKIVRVKN